MSIWIHTRFGCRRAACANARPRRSPPTVRKQAGSRRRSWPLPFSGTKRAFEPVPGSHAGNPQSDRHGRCSGDPLPRGEAARIAGAGNTGLWPTCRYKKPSGEVAHEGVADREWRSAGSKQRQTSWWMDHASSRQRPPWFQIAAPGPLPTATCVRVLSYLWSVRSWCYAYKRGRAGLRPSASSAARTPASDSMRRLNAARWVRPSRSMANMPAHRNMM